MQLIAQVANVFQPMPIAIGAAAFVWLISLIGVGLLIACLVKHGLGRRNCGPNLPLIIMLIVVAAFYFKHHGVMAVTNETQSSQT
ncbi:MAG TPA: hypothetical protein VGF52_02890, partial [Tepidisphaeraceae bacterium]